MPYTAYNSVASVSLATSGGTESLEQYIPLWIMSSQSVGPNPATATLGTSFLVKGSTNNASSTSSKTQLHTLNAQWLSTQMFALEVAFYTANASNSVNAALWDMTTNSIVLGSTVTSTSTTMIVVRSGSFTLMPSHSYAITMWGSGAVYTILLSKAHLVALNS